jgi:hypothetical protein
MAVFLTMNGTRRPPGTDDLREVSAATGYVRNSSRGTRSSTSVSEP